MVRLAGIAENLLGVVIIGGFFFFVYSLWKKKSMKESLDDLAQYIEDEKK
jgi:hypothetical protein|tara:strand:+ start:10452 stop:10601 length:150 start_codon:yes stop_codon:yes gene_type:complete